ncbi:MULTISPECIES: hypothetical protein [unclassified Sphingomonas]|nr:MULTISPECIES: hypothetical protein [unclassified Sphingomonas]
MKPTLRACAAAGGYQAARRKAGKGRRARAAERLEDNGLRTGE